MYICERIVGNEVVQMMVTDKSSEDDAGKTVDQIENDVAGGMSLIDSILLRSSGKPYTIRKRD
jgi:hypothetical protein